MRMVCLIFFLLKIGDIWLLLCMSMSILYMDILYILFCLFGELLLIYTLLFTLCSILFYVCSLGVCQNSSKKFYLEMTPKKMKNVAGSSSSSRFDATLFPSLAKSEAYNELYPNRAVSSGRQINSSFHSTEEYGFLMARRWDFLYTFDLDEINVSWVREFYCNKTIRDGDFITFVRQKNFVISPSVLASFIGIE